MKNIQEILNGLGVEIEASVLDKLNKEVLENYKTINDYNKLKDKQEKAETDLANANTQINELNTQIQGLDGSKKEVDDLKKTIADMQKAESERIEREKIEKENADLLNNYNEIVKDKKFVNEITKNALFNEVKEELNKGENKGKGINEIFEVLVKDREGIFENANPSVIIKPSEQIDNNADINEARSIMGLPPVK